MRQQQCTWTIFTGKLLYGVFEISVINSLTLSNDMYHLRTKKHEFVWKSSLSNLKYYLAFAGLKILNNVTKLLYCPLHIFSTLLSNLVARHASI